jgi:hypothetical protein
MIGKRFSRTLLIALIIGLSSAAVMGVVYMSRTINVTGTLKVGSGIEIYSDAECTIIHSGTITLTTFYYGTGAQKFNIYIKNTGSTPANVYWNDNLAVPGVTVGSQAGFGDIPVTLLTFTWAENQKKTINPGQGIWLEYSLTPPATGTTEQSMAFTLTIESRDT